MAGGKETPRQKMIGMMYLVLTALLALQVSSAIIQKFIFLDESLMNVNQKSSQENTDLKAKIEKAVQLEGNKDKVISDKAAEVRAKTTEVIKYMNDLREEMIMASGGRDPEDNSYKGAKEETAIEVMMVGQEGTGKGKGYELQKTLNSFSEYLNAELKKLGAESKVPKLALDGSEDPIFKDDKEQKRKDFAQLNFAQTPMVAALAVLAQKQSEVLKYENEILGNLAAQVGAADLKFDNVVAMMRPESKIVAAGTKYEADLFLAASSSAITPTMTFNGRPIKVDNNTKIGKVAFVAPPARSYDKEGLAKMTWTGAINFKFKGKDTTFKKSFEYFVAKPVIQVQSASVQALYRNCGNELNIQVPALGTSYNPKFSVNNGYAIASTSKKGMVTIVPNPSARKVSITVSSNGNTIGTEEFQVRGIPRPEIVAMAGTKPANEKQGEPAPGPRTLKMDAVAEENFKAFLPKDAQYKVTEWECILVRGKRPVNTKRVSGPFTSLNDFASMAQPGDRILIDVKKVERKNFKGQMEEVPVGTVIKNIPLY